MALALLLGGVRSGKSSLALRMAAASGRPVTLIATAEARDDEMAERIARHRAERPTGWTTLEEPTELVDALDRAPAQAYVIVDCLTLWVANLIEQGRPESYIASRAAAAAALASTRPGGAVAVTNEVGSGVIPISELGRRYTEILGRVNQLWAAAAGRCLLVVAGRTLELGDPAASMRGGLDG